ncbi:MAG TPA: LOG family protein [Campylobacteraceae bacterium]|nr:LOG family protein [Campylobacteraceae bacterium]HHD83685.1 LOG family protein [Campylobacteraceae bacterium]
MHIKKSFIKPPNRRRRKSELPWQHPKPRTEDPEALKRINAIMKSPSYKLAAEDHDFLFSDETLPVRLQLDYLKPELVLRNYGIERTIVVFGSTRIVEQKSALKKLEEAQRALAKEPDSDKLLKAVRKAERILEKSKYYDMARAFGRLVGEAGGGCEDNRVAVMTGGGPGIMEAANRGAFDVGAKTIGLNITLPHEQFPNPYITPDLCFQFYYFAIRKMHFLKRAAGLVVCPGGYGTLDELFETLTLIQTRKINPVPVIFLGREYWEKLIDFEMLEIEGTIDPEDRDLFWFAESAQEAWEGMQAWHEANKTPLFPKE